MESKEPVPKTYTEFMSRYPQLGQAWDLTAEAAKQGPLDEKTLRLLKLAMSMGAMREGAVHAGVRKAQDLGVPAEEIYQVVALVAGTLGFPATVAVFSWVKDELEGKES